MEEAAAGEKGQVAFSRQLSANTQPLKLLSVAAPVADGVDEGGLALLDLLDGALERGLKFVGAFEGSFAVPAHGAREAREIGIRIEEVHADMGAAGIGAAGSGQNQLVVPIGRGVREVSGFGYFILVFLSVR